MLEGQSAVTREDGLGVAKHVAEDVALVPTSQPNPSSWPALNSSASFLPVSTMAEKRHMYQRAHLWANHGCTTIPLPYAGMEPPTEAPIATMLIIPIASQNSHDLGPSILCDFCTMVGPGILLYSARCQLLSRSIR